MGGYIPDKYVSVWRSVATPGGYEDTQVYSEVAAAIVPVSKQDHQQAYSLESTHVLWVGRWLELLKEDEVRYGQRDPDPAGLEQAEVFTVNGRARYSLGGQQQAYYCTERT